MTTTPETIMQYPCDKFAAFLAHCLNSEDLSVLRMDEGSLYDLLTNALETRYAQPLMHHPGYAWRMSPDEAAERYLEITLKRPLQLSPRVKVSVAQRLLEALCHRGVEPSWADASVARESDCVGSDSVPRAIPMTVQREFSHCSQKLAKLPDRVSPGSPSPTLQARFGAIVLRLYGLQARVPEEISLWNALVCAPRTLRALPPGKPFNDFCCLVIDGIRTAHRPYQELVGLGHGLCPFDWMEVLSIQQTRSLRKFLRALDEGTDSGAKSGWERAWQAAPVSGFRSAEALWESEIGCALRLPQSRSRIDSALIETLPDPDSLAEDEPVLLEEDRFDQLVERLACEGVISAVEHSILQALYSGKTKADVLGLTGVRQHLKTTGLTYEKLLEDLERRVHEWANSQQGGNHGQ